MYKKDTNNVNEKRTNKQQNIDIKFTTSIIYNISIIHIQDKL